MNLHVNNGNITQTNVTDIMINAVLGAMGSAVGGSKHLDKLSNQSFKRIGQALAHKIGNM